VNGRAGCADKGAHAAALVGTAKSSMISSQHTGFCFLDSLAERAPAELGGVRGKRIVQFGHLRALSLSG